MSYTDLETHLNIISCIEVYNDELYMSALSQYYRKNEEGYLIVYKDKETVNFKLVYELYEYAIHLTSILKSKKYIS
jgi:hypothetical protein